MKLFYTRGTVPFHSSRTFFGMVLRPKTKYQTGKKIIIEIKVNTRKVTNHPLNLKQCRHINLIPSKFNHKMNFRYIISIKLDMSTDVLNLIFTDYRRLFLIS